MKPFLICKRILCCFFITVILTVSCFAVFNKPVKTSANPIVIGGAIIAGLGAFMASAGITLTNNGISDGQGLQTMWENILHDFSYENKALQDWYVGGNKIANFIIGKENNAKIAVLSKEFANWLNEAKKWLVNKFTISSSAATSIYAETSVVFPAGSYPVFNSGVTYDHIVGFDYTPNEPIIIPINNAGLYYTITYEGVSTDYWGLYHITLNYAFSSEPILDLNVTGTRNYYDNPSDHPADNMRPCFVTQDGHLYLGKCERYRNTSEYLVNIWDCPQVNLSHETADIGMEGTLTEGYSDFEQALEDANTQAGTGEGASIGIEVGGVDVDQPYTQERLVDGTIDGMLDNTLTGELVGGYEDEDEAEKENDAEAVPNEGEITENIVKIDGIEDFFPFCIPFDLFHLIQKFNVSPVTPKFTGTLNFAGIFNNFEIDIDLTPFNTIASLFRIIFIIGFVIFLIIKTRDLIRG